MTTTPDLDDLLDEYDRALAYTDLLFRDLSAEEIRWRAGEDASAIGWHLGHQAAVAHYMVRNLTAAEPPIDAAMDALMDSATAEPRRGALPDVEQIVSYRHAVSDRLRFRIGNIIAGDVGAPTQLRVVARTLLVTVVNHEYQHDKWIDEVRTGVHGKDSPPTPVSPHLVELDGYLTLLP